MYLPYFGQDLDLKEKVVGILAHRGVVTKFRLGGGTDRDWGDGRTQVNRNHLPPNSDFSSDFAHFSLEI